MLYFTFSMGKHFYSHFIVSVWLTVIHIYLLLECNKFFFEILCVLWTLDIPRVEYQSALIHIADSLYFILRFNDPARSGEKQFTFDCARYTLDVLRNPRHAHYDKADIVITFKKIKINTNWIISRIHCLNTKLEIIPGKDLMHDFHLALISAVSLQVDGSYLVFLLLGDPELSLWWNQATFNHVCFLPLRACRQILALELELLSQPTILAQLLLVGPWYPQIIDPIYCFYAYNRLNFFFWQIFRLKWNWYSMI